MKGKEREGEQPQLYSIFTGCHSLPLALISPVLVVGLVPVDLVAVVACFCSVGIKTNELQCEASVERASA